MGSYLLEPCTPGTRLPGCSLLRALVDLCLPLNVCVHAEEESKMEQNANQTVTNTEIPALLQLSVAISLAVFCGMFAFFAYLFPGVLCFVLSVLSIGSGFLCWIAFKGSLKKFLRKSGRNTQKLEQVK